MFKIGDEVMIVDDPRGDCPYSITTPGSIGTVVSFSDDNDDDDEERITVLWHNLTSYVLTHRQTYSVSPRYLKLVTEPFDVSGKYSRVIRKIKYLEKKFKERNLSYDF